MHRSRKIPLALLLGTVILLGCVSMGTGQADATNAKRVSSGKHNFTIRVGGLKRHYTVHVPPSYDGRTPVPVVKMLHGGGGSGKAAVTETGWGAKSEFSSRASPTALR